VSRDDGGLGFFILFITFFVALFGGDFDICLLLLFYGMINT